MEKRMVQAYVSPWGHTVPVRSDVQSPNPPPVANPNSWAVTVLPGGTAARTVDSRENITTICSFLTLSRVDCLMYSSYKKWRRNTTQTLITKAWVDRSVSLEDHRIMRPRCKFMDLASFGGNFSTRSPLIAAPSWTNRLRVWTIRFWKHHSESMKEERTLHQRQETHYHFFFMFLRIWIA